VRTQEAYYLKRKIFRFLPLAIDPCGTSSKRKTKQSRENKGVRRTGWEKGRRREQQFAREVASYLWGRSLDQKTYGTVP